MIAFKSKICRTMILTLMLSTVMACRTVGGSSNVLAENSAGQSTVPQVVRFAIWLDALEQDMEGNSPEIAAEKLTAGSARVAAFNLQGLGRLYEDTDPAFEKARKRFKSLEDGIGGFAKWDELLAKAQKNGSAVLVVKKLESKRAAAKASLAELLVSEKFVATDGSRGYLEKFRKFLNKFAWTSPEEDRRIMLGKLKNELETVKTTVYDFTHLEAGNGIHEFRRKLRWISMEARALNGLIVHKPAADGCPVDAWKDLPTSVWATGKYGALPPSALEPKPVAITPCLYLRVTKAIDEVGAIKGAVEEVDNSTEGEATDGVSPADQAAVKAILQEMLSNDLFGKLQAELSVG